MAIIVCAVLIFIVALIVEERSGILRAGSPAPGFSARSSTGETITLRDYLGKTNVVLFFYPKDFTAGCTAEVCGFRDRFTRIRELGAVVLGVSYDDSASHRRFVESYHLPYPLITDADGSIARAYGVTRLGGVVALVKRTTFVIDREGMIRSVIRHELTMSRHIEDVITVLEAIGHR